MVKRSGSQLITPSSFISEKSFEDWHKSRTRWEHPTNRATEEFSLRTFAPGSGAHNHILVTCVPAQALANQVLVTITLEKRFQFTRPRPLRIRAATVGVQFFIRDAKEELRSVLRPGRYPFTFTY